MITVKFKSSGMPRCVVGYIFSDVSKHHSVFIFGVKQCNKRGSSAVLLLTQRHSVTSLKTRSFRFNTLLITAPAWLFSSPPLCSVAEIKRPGHEADHFRHLRTMSWLMSWCKCSFGVYITIVITSFHKYHILWLIVIYTAVLTCHRTTGWIPLNERRFIWIATIQGVPGGMDKTSGGCSLCWTIPI